MGLRLRTDAGRYASTIDTDAVQSWTRNKPNRRMLHMRTPNHCHDCGEPLPDTVYAVPRKVIVAVILGMNEASCTPQEIAHITGHSIRSVMAILDRYSARSDKVAITAIAKLERGGT
jgi:hypothetical protein